MGGKITNVKKITKTDLESGQIIETEIEQTLNFGKTDDFVMTFTKDLGYMKNLSKGEIVVFFGLLQIVNNNNEIVLNTGIKERLSKNFEIKLESINQIIYTLSKKQMIQKTEDRGIYLLNTFLFGKGKWNDIKKMRMYIEWDFKEKTKKVMLEKEYLDEEELLERDIEQQKLLLKKLEEKREKNLFNFNENEESKY